MQLVGQAARGGARLLSEIHCLRHSDLRMRGASLLQVLSSATTNPSRSCGLL